MLPTPARAEAQALLRKVKGLGGRVEVLPGSRLQLQVADGARDKLADLRPQLAALRVEILELLGAANDGDHPGKRCSECRACLYHADAGQLCLIQARVRQRYPGEPVPVYCPHKPPVG
jgi:hypothetical protein